MHSEHHYDSVGKSKAKLIHGRDVLPKHRSTSPTKQRKYAGDFFFQIKEFEEFQNPSFNVLYVQTPRPKVLESSLMKALATTIDETIDLVKPVLRFGIPKSSLMDKTPYYTERLLPIQMAAKEMAASKERQEQEQQQQQQQPQKKQQMKKKQQQKLEEMAAHKSEQEGKQSQAEHHDHAHGHGHAHGHAHGHGQGHGHGGHAGHSHGHGHEFIPSNPKIHPERFYLHEMPPWVVLALNIAAHCYLGGGLTFRGA